MKRSALAIVLALSNATSAHAYVSGDGHAYDLTCSADGYRLKASYPVVRFVGQGAGTRTVSSREVLALGRSCDAYLKVLGYGKWCWANGGFRAEFPDGTTIGFPRQELSCPIRQDYESQCGC